MLREVVVLKSHLFVFVVFWLFPFFQAGSILYGTFKVVDQVYL